MSGLSTHGDDVITLDLDAQDLTSVNRRLHAAGAADNARDYRILNPRGKHAIAAGLNQAINVDIEGHVGFYCAGMNKAATVTVHGQAGSGVAENMMSGVVRVKGNASQSAGATGRGGLLVIEGDASSRCGISMKGIDIVVAGSVGHMSCFLGQRGHLVICGDAGRDLGDSLYEAQIFVRGRVESLGADCVEKEMSPEHLATLRELLARAGIEADPAAFRRYGSARQLYNFHIDNADAL